MFDLTLLKDLTESIGKSLTFPDIDTIGRYIFKEYNSHKLENVPDNITISPMMAARRLITECEKRNRLEDLVSFMIEADGSPLNGKTVKLAGLENFLFRLSRTGMYFDFNKRKIVSLDEDKSMLVNWGALKEGKEYPIVIASIDICQNSELVKKYNSQKMEKVYYRLWEFFKHKISNYNGRIWSWAGDGGLIAFHNEKGPSIAVSSCLETLLSMPVFNLNPHKAIDDAINLRIGMDMGKIKFFNDTGRIISDTINFAAHLEKKATPVNGLAISDKIFDALEPGLKELFRNEQVFEERKIYSLQYEFSKTLS
jgi:class 3 adenylate cyclase